MNAVMVDAVTSANQRLGDLDEKLGDLSGARADFEAGLAIRQRLSAADPTNTDLQYYVSAFMRRLGDLAAKQSDVVGARRAYEVTASPSASGSRRPTRRRLQLQNAVALDLEDLAGVAFTQNDMAAARADYDACLAIRRQLADADPTNAALQQLILRALTRSSAGIRGQREGWRRSAAKYERIEQAHQLTPGDEKVLEALHAHGFSEGHRAWPATSWRRRRRRRRRRSYKREDEPRVAVLVQAPEGRPGLEVWWDQILPGGEAWRENIQAAIDAAGCVVVVWSHRLRPARTAASCATQKTRRPSSARSWCRSRSTR